MLSKAERRAAASLGDGWLSLALDDTPVPSEALGTLQRATEAATPHQLPIGVLGGGELGAALVVLRLADFAAWFSPDGNSVVCLRAGQFAPGGGS